MDTLELFKVASNRQNYQLSELAESHGIVL